MKTETGLTWEELEVENPLLSAKDLRARQDRLKTSYESYRRLKLTLEQKNQLREEMLRYDSTVVNLYYENAGRYSCFFFRRMAVRVCVCICSEPAFDRFFCRRDYVRVHRHYKQSGYRLWKDYVIWREGPWCWLCHTEIDRSLTSPHPMSMSLDHVTPQVLGGSDDPENLRPAHRRCNSSRQDKHPGVYRDLQFTPSDMALTLARKKVAS
jgi:5-methylcytosine-specific restriction endonuclease McrA